MASWVPSRRGERGRSLSGPRCGHTAATATAVEAAPELELLAEAKLNIVCFRYRPPGMGEPELDELNRRLGAMVLEDGRVFFGTTVYGGNVAFRPAIVNWRTTEGDVDLIVDVVRELGKTLV